LLSDRIGGATVVLHPSAAEKLGLGAGQRVRVSFDGVSDEALLQVDDTISTGVVLVPRSMGLAIREPVAARVQNPAKGR